MGMTKEEFFVILLHHLALFSSNKSRLLLPFHSSAFSDFLNMGKFPIHFPIFEKSF